jgi:hypothetical protein
MDNGDNYSNGLRRFEKVISSDVLAISTVSVIQFLQSGTPLESPLDVSLYCFAVSTPLATATLLLSVFEEELSPPRWLTRYVGAGLQHLAVRLTHGRVVDAYRLFAKTF